MPIPLKDPRPFPRVGEMALSGGEKARGIGEKVLGGGENVFGGRPDGVALRDDGRGVPGELGIAASITDLGVGIAMRAGAIGVPADLTGSSSSSFIDWRSAGLPL